MNNNAPFYVGQKVVCINNKPLPERSHNKATEFLTEGQTYTVEYLIPGDFDLPITLQLVEVGWGSYCSSRFKPLDDLYSDITAELASKVEVGDTADQPVRVLSN